MVYQHTTKNGKELIGNAIMPLMGKAIIEKLIPYLQKENDS